MIPFQPDVLWRRLQSSPFRARFRLNAKDQAYLEGKGLPLILSHARDFIDRRLAAHPKNDGKQTPMRGHPVFVAQHATATCCRGCLEKWHGIPQGVTLDERQKDYIVQAIALWLVRRGSARDVSGTNIFDPDRGL
ncbi:DUF4186 domain-containing protein [Serratia marcescens]|uniref:DUF4186 domain-containing protein n=1 Tax=Serratia marcescens TaxID=615 RepID=UPI0018D8D2AC|nr:DUF4186 domain-containing protein [Serratia marcescens]